MKKVLIVSPSFPPVIAADVHRVRTSVPFYADFGWQPTVLAVEATAHGGLVEPELASLLPPDLEVVRTRALPKGLTRVVGVGNVALRAWPHLYLRGAQLIRAHAIDLVYFSTTMFPAMSLGRLWKARFGTPYVIDMQDPWKSDYRGAGAAGGLKARLARRMHGVLEPLAMRRVDGIISVSPAYSETLRQRYASIQEAMCTTIPFGASEADWEAAARLTWRNAFFDRTDGHIHGVSVGRGGGDLAEAAQLLFDAVRLRADRAGGAASLRLSFIGTSYAGDAARPTIAPVAHAAGQDGIVQEIPARVPYLHGLRLLRDAHFTIILGSDDPGYSPSKVYPYLLAGRPFVAVLHEASPVVPLLRQAGSGVVVTFGPGTNRRQGVAQLAADLDRILEPGAVALRPPSSLLESISPRELTRRQCLAFDAAVRHAWPHGVPCAE